MDIDFNLENYDLNDILELFSLDYHFTKDDLKKAKKIVLQTHPDKSRLDKKYFLFFSAAYKIVYQIFDFRYKSEQCVSRNNNEIRKTNPTYTIEEEDKHGYDHDQLIKQIKDKKNFNKWFNELFEKSRIKDSENDSGYGKWFRNDENEDEDESETALSSSSESIITKDSMHEAFERKKKIMRDKAIILHQEVDIMDSGSHHFDIGRQKVENYSSSLFSKLPYEDLKKAHTETVVPVTHEDYLNKKKFKSVNEMQKFRGAQDTRTLTEDESMKILSNNKRMEDKRTVQRAYRLAKQDEMVRKSNDVWWSSLKQLTNF